jgi:uncharacterized protein YajQ (UPF0234 family)
MRWLTPKSFYRISPLKTINRTGIPDGSVCFIDRRVLMPSFDVISEVDMHEVTIAVDQTNREIGTRFDFKGVDAKVEQNKAELTLTAEADFHIKQMIDMLKARLIKRGIDVSCMEEGPLTQNLKQAKQTITLKQGIDKENAKKITKLIKDAKIKAQPEIQGEKIRISGKKRDDLQEAIALLRKAELPIPLQYDNFRD